MHYLFQDGKHVFRHAVKGMADVSAEIMKKNNLSGDDIRYLVSPGKSEDHRRDSTNNGNYNGQSDAEHQILWQHDRGDHTPLPGRLGVRTQERRQFDIGGVWGRVHLGIGLCKMGV